MSSYTFQTRGPSKCSTVSGPSFLGRCLVVTLIMGDEEGCPFSSPFRSLLPESSNATASAEAYHHVEIPQTPMILSSQMTTYLACAESLSRQIRLINCCAVQDCETLVKHENICQWSIHSKELCPEGRSLEIVRERARERWRERLHWSHPPRAG
jgi:hypothetical protein